MSQQFNDHRHNNIQPTPPHFLSQTTSTINSILPIFILLDQIHEYTTFNIVHTPSTPQLQLTSFLSYPPLVKFLHSLEEFTINSKDFKDLLPNAQQTSQTTPSIADESFPCHLHSTSNPFKRTLSVLSTHQSTYFHFDSDISVDSNGWYIKDQPFGALSTNFDQSTGMRSNLPDTYSIPIKPPFTPSATPQENDSSTNLLNELNVLNQQEIAPQQYADTSEYTARQTTIRAEFAKFFSYSPLHSLHLFDIVAFFYQEYYSQVAMRRQHIYPESPSSLLSLHAIHTSQRSLTPLQHIATHPNPHGLYNEEDISLVKEYYNQNHSIASVLSTQLDWSSFLLILTSILTHILPLPTKSTTLARQPQYQHPHQQHMRQQQHLPAPSPTSPHSQSPPTPHFAIAPTVNHIPPQRLSQYSSFITTFLNTQTSTMLSPLQFLSIGYLLSRIVLFDSSYTSLTLANITNTLNHKMISLQLFSEQFTPSSSLSSSFHHDTNPHHHHHHHQRDPELTQSMHLQNYLDESWAHNVSIIHQHIQQQYDTVRLHTQSNYHELKGFPLQMQMQYPAQFSTTNQPHNQHNQHNQHNHVNNFSASAFGSQFSSYGNQNGLSLSQFTSPDLPVTNQLYILNYYLLMFYPILQALDQIFQAYFQINYISQTFLQSAPSSPSQYNTNNKTQQQSHTVQTYLIQSISLIHIYSILVQMYFSMQQQQQQQQQQRQDQDQDQGQQQQQQQQQQPEPISILLDPNGFPDSTTYHNITVNLISLINNDRFSTFIKHATQSLKDHKQQSLSSNHQHNDTTLLSYFPSTQFNPVSTELPTSNNNPLSSQPSPLHIFCTCHMASALTGPNDGSQDTPSGEANNDSYVNFQGEALYLPDLENLHQILLNFTTTSVKNDRNLSKQHQHQSVLRSISTSLQNSQMQQSYLSQHLIKLFSISLNLFPTKSLTQSLRFDDTAGNQTDESRAHSTSLLSSPAPSLRDKVSNPQYNHSLHLRRIINNLSLLLHLSLPEDDPRVDLTIQHQQQSESIDEGGKQQQQQQQQQDQVKSTPNPLDFDAASNTTLTDEVDRLQKELSEMKKKLTLKESRVNLLTFEIEELQAKNVQLGQAAKFGENNSGIYGNQAASAAAGFYGEAEGDPTARLVETKYLDQLESFYEVVRLQIRRDYFRHAQLYCALALNPMSTLINHSVKKPFFNANILIPAALGYIQLNHSKIQQKLYGAIEPSQAFTIPYISSTKVIDKTCPHWIRDRNASLASDSNNSHNQSTPHGGLPLLDEKGYYQLWMVREATSVQPPASTGTAGGGSGGSGGGSGGETGRPRMALVRVCLGFEPTAQLSRVQHTDLMNVSRSYALNASGVQSITPTPSNLARSTTAIPPSTTYPHQQQQQQQQHQINESFTSTNLPSASMASPINPTAITAQTLSSNAFIQQSNLFSQLVDNNNILSTTPLDLFSIPSHHLPSPLEFLTQLQGSPSPYTDKPPQYHLTQATSSNISPSPFSEEQFLYHINYLFNGAHYHICNAQVPPTYLHPIRIMFAHAESAFCSYIAEQCRLILFKPSSPLGLSQTVTVNFETQSVHIVNYVFTMIKIVRFPVLITYSRWSDTCVRDQEFPDAAIVGAVYHQDSSQSKQVTGFWDPNAPIAPFSQYSYNLVELRLPFRRDLAAKKAAAAAAAEKSTSTSTDTSNPTPQ